MNPTSDWTVDSPRLVESGATVDVRQLHTTPPKDAPDKKDCKRKLADLVARFAEGQQRLYAQDQMSMLLVFQAMDAAGKDSTIRAVTTGVNPAGFQVHSFKKPSAEELDHDFLWRTTRALPERGRIGIFNRSQYEEVLVVRVQPELLQYQQLPHIPPPEQLWEARYRSICDQEAHLARNGTVVVKFFLHVSRDTQARRFLRRIDVPGKNWKFSPGDLDTRARWDAYMDAYDQLLGATSRPWAPWYIIPADDKPYMRMTVADIMVRTLEKMNPQYPTVSEEDWAQMQALRGQISAEISSGENTG